jgi:hypothetical protein
VLTASIIGAMLLMEAASTSETSVNICQTTQRNNPEDSYQHTRRRENLTLHKTKYHLRFSFPCELPSSGRRNSYRNNIT